MEKMVLKDDEGNPILYISQAGTSIHCEFEQFGSQFGAGHSDLEFSCDVEASEFWKVYKKYQVNPEVPILEAIQQVSDKGRGRDLKRDIGDWIASVNSFSWMSFDDA